MRGLFGDARNHFAFKVLQARTDFTQQRYRLSESLAAELNYTVRYGPFSGLRLNRDSWWSAADRGAMLLGMYEREVLERLAVLLVGKRYFVDVGAADGYYAVGALVAGLVKHAYCYEMSTDSQDVIRGNAKINGVDDCVSIFGSAEPGFLSALVRDNHLDPSEGVLLMDVEGYEENLLSGSDLHVLKEMPAIIEIHERAISPYFLDDIIAWSKANRVNVQMLTTEARDLSPYQELRDWPDDDRWMICSEGRAYRMVWLATEPER